MSRTRLSRLSRLCRLLCGALALALSLALTASPLVWAAPDRGATYTFAFQDAGVSQVAEAVLGQALGVSYSVDPSVNVRLTFRIDRRLTKEQLLKAFEQILAAQGLVLIKEGDSVTITTRDKARSATAAQAPSQNVRRAGYQTLAVPLSYATPSEVAKALTAITGSSDIVVYADDQSGLLVLGGTSDELDAALDLVHMIDHSSLEGAKMRWFELSQASAPTVADDLDKILKAAGVGNVTIVPLSRLNGILAFAHTSDQLDQVATWVVRLDVISHESATSLWSYHPRSLSAESLAETLSEVLFGEAPSQPPQAAQSPKPSSSAISSSHTQDAPTVTPDPSPPASRPGHAYGAALQTTADEEPVRVGVEKETNTLLVECSSKRWIEIQRMLDQIDQTPGQVLIEASILEVNLNKEMKFGVDWSVLAADAGRLAIASIPDNGAGVASQLPGFTATFLTKGIKVAVNTLGTHTNVDVVSAPKIIVLDNHTAKLNVGDQVPIVTQAAVDTIAPGSPIVNSINYQNTGVIMSVTPRVTGDNRIFLDISEQVSTAIETNTSGIDSPTIQQREFDSSLVLPDGGTVALGGLISTNRTHTEAGIPYLKDAPWIGNLFKTQDHNDQRTELIVLISATIIKDGSAAARAMGKLRSDMQEMRAHGLLPEQ